ncbi:collagen alpha-1(III) chain-like [Delphinapterus leucas]|uniref:Collagen alpha-1(III) chain-like n=1 Tax=Delphinapterus leucas TaxID=9749 RepID=A0A7F8K3Y9_DELLE|nr:collagen alpha-1(III) chain-like [Delphinapterus leucas]
MLSKGRGPARAGAPERSERSGRRRRRRRREEEQEKRPGEEAEAAEAEAEAAAAAAAGGAGLRAVPGRRRAGAGTALRAALAPRDPRRPGRAEGRGRPGGGGRERRRGRYGVVRRAQRQVTLWPAGGRAAVPALLSARGPPGPGTPGAAGARRAEGRRLGPGSAAREGGDRARRAASATPGSRGARATPAGALLSDAGGSRAGPGLGRGWGPRRRAVKAALPGRPESGRRAPLQPPVRPRLGGGAGPSRAGARPGLGSFLLVLPVTPLPGPNPKSRARGLAARQPGKCDKSRAVHRRQFLMQLSASAISSPHACLATALEHGGSPFIQLHFRAVWPRTGFLWITHLWACLASPGSPMVRTRRPLASA